MLKNIYVRYISKLFHKFSKKYIKIIIITYKLKKYYIALFNNSSFYKLFFDVILSWISLNNCKLKCFFKHKILLSSSPKVLTQITKVLTINFAHCVIFKTSMLIKNTIQTTKTKVWKY